VSPREKALRRLRCGDFLGLSAPGYSQGRQDAFIRRVPPRPQKPNSYTCRREQYRPAPEVAAAREAPASGPGAPRRAPRDRWLEWLTRRRIDARGWSLRRDGAQPPGASYRTEEEKTGERPGGLRFVARPAARRAAAPVVSNSVLVSHRALTSWAENWRRGRHCESLALQAFLLRVTEGRVPWKIGSHSSSRRSSRNQPSSM
jgi:hypothetical protein